MLYLALVGLIAVLVTVAIVRLRAVVRRYRFFPVTSETELPTVSVCIPARNEMHAMTECLERVLASDYPKLEIIVLDDSSVDDTSMLIKSFAHAGVRFVEGAQLEADWLGKNNALQGLLEEASGQYVLFLDVDTSLRPYSVRQLVTKLMSGNQTLISVLPKREDGLRASVFLGTMRYFWLLMLDTVKKPAVSGASWLVSRDALLKIDGLNSYKNATQPEIAITRALGIAHGSQLVISNAQLGISYEKKWSSQVETSIRLLRPQFSSSWRSLFIALLLLAIVIVPPVGIVLFALENLPVGVYVSGATMVLITLLSLQYFRAAWRYGWWLGALHWPYVMIQEAILIIASVISYARGQVTWKGRSVTK